MMDDLEKKVRKEIALGLEHEQRTQKFLERELRKLFEDGTVIASPQFSECSCVGTLRQKLRVRVQFARTDVYSCYNALMLTVLDSADCAVDAQVLNLKDILGVKPVPGYNDGVSPCIWDGYKRIRWYAYQPTAADYDLMRKAVDQYLSAFRERSPYLPKLVYICAPLQGDAAKNIEFARQKAQEISQKGDIPICPHLVFQPIPNVEGAIQGCAVREVSLRLLEICQEVRVFGDAVTKEMRMEIDHAMRQCIPVISKRRILARKASCRSVPKKEKGER